MGRGGRRARTLAVDQFKDFGYDEGRTVELPSWDAVYNCGDTSDPNDEHSCKCGGKFYMGYKNRPDNGAEITTFEGMHPLGH